MRDSELLRDVLGRLAALRDCLADHDTATADQVAADLEEDLLCVLAEADAT